MIEMAVTIVEQSGGQYHVLLIIADGQVCMLHLQHCSFLKSHLCKGILFSVVEMFRMWYWNRWQEAWILTLDYWAPKNRGQLMPSSKLGQSICDFWHAWFDIVLTTDSCLAAVSAPCPSSWWGLEMDPGTWWRNSMITFLLDLSTISRYRDYSTQQFGFILYSVFLFLVFDDVNCIK